MMTDVEMTDDEVRQQVERADRFIADFREMIAATVVDPASACADYQRRGLQRIADTLDAVPFVTMCNLSNLNTAMRGAVLDLIEVQLMCVGGGPNAGLCGRDSIPRHVPADNRHGVGAAAQLTLAGRRPKRSGIASRPSLFFRSSHGRPMACFVGRWFSEYFKKWLR